MREGRALGSEGGGGGHEVQAKIMSCGMGLS